MKKTIFKKHNLIFKMTLIAVFAALNFCIMLLPKIPIPSLVGKPYVHLGNLIVVLTSIFFGGIIGGLSGAIGMGIYDLTTGYGIWTLKTVILKFGIGIVTGLVYKLIKNRNDKNLKAEMIGVGSFFLLISLFTSVVAFLQHGTFVINDVTINIPWPLYVFSFILGSVLAIAGFTSNSDIRKAMYASSLGIVFNIFGELLGGFLKKLLTGNGVRVSLAMAIASLPATIINGCVVLLVVFAVFLPINKAISKLMYEGEDIVADDLEESSEEDINDEASDFNEIDSFEFEVTENNSLEEEK